jgi:hypothetical protein
VVALIEFSASYKISPFEFLIQMAAPSNVFWDHVGHLSVFYRVPTEGYTQGGKFWVRRRRDQEREGARNTNLDRFGLQGA